MEHHLDIFNSVVIPYVNFAIFLAVFIFFFRKPLAAMALGRRTKYLDASKEAAKALEEAQRKFTEIKTKFDSLENELNTFKAQSEKLAADEAAKLVADGEKLAAQIVSETKKIAFEEINRARTELRHEIVMAAKAAAEQKIEASLNDSEKARILSGRLNDLRGFQV